MYIYKSNLSCAEFHKRGDYAKKYISELRSEYEDIKNKPLPELTEDLFFQYRQTGNRINYETEYFLKRKFLRDFALTAWLHKDKEAAARLEDTIISICGERTWALPAHITDKEPEEITVDLFAAETAQALAEIVSLLSDMISERTALLCAGEVKKRVLNPYMNRKERYGWENSKSNWAAVCGGCVGMAAIYLIEDGEHIERIAKELKCVFESYFGSFTEDGACSEGLYYWNYGMMYFTAFADLYRQRAGKTFSIDPALEKKAAAFGAKCCLRNGYTISVSDGGERSRINSGLLHKLHEIYGVNIPDKEYMAYLGGDECARWCKAVRDVSWYGEGVSLVEEERVIFPSAQWAILRSENICLTFKGGNNGEPHNHNDIGSFTVIKNGEMILCDLGAGEYTAEYFSENRYNVLCTRSMGHSVPLFDGAEQETGEMFCARGFSASERKAGADIAGAYKSDKIKQCKREVYCSEDEATLCDIIVSEGETAVMERFITRLDAEIADGAVKIMSLGKCVATIKSNGDYNIEIVNYTHNEHDGTKTTVTAIDFKLKVNGVHKFMVNIS